MYSNLGTDSKSIVSICNTLNLEQNQTRFVKRKYERFGLLQCRNEKINNDNLRLNRYIGDLLIYSTLIMSI